MMIFTEDLYYPAEQIAEANAILSGKTPFPHSQYDEEIISFASVDFGWGWELDINIVKGLPTPYVDAILFHDGSEVYVWEISESVIGEWQVVLGADINRAFRLQIFEALEGEETV